MIRDQQSDEDLKRVAPVAQESLAAYVEKGRPLGDFLKALIMDKLMETITRADDRNIHLLKELGMWVYWNVPTSARYTQENYETWIRSGGEEGIKKLLSKEESDVKG